MNAADPKALSRLAKICGMFGSSYPAERAVAAERAEAVRLSLNTSWEDLLLGARPRQPAPPEFDPLDADPAALVARCAEILTPWEREFLTSIAGRRSHTPKQAHRLQEIRRKCAAWWAHRGAQ